jgi:hypothetical protein
VDEFSNLGDGFNVDDVALPSNKHLSFRLTAVDCWGIGEDLVSEQVIVEAVDVERWIRCVPSFEQVSGRECRFESILGRVLECLLDGSNR